MTIPGQSQFSIGRDHIGSLGPLLRLVLHTEPLDFWLSTLHRIFSVGFHCTFKRSPWTGFEMAQGRHSHLGLTSDSLHWRGAQALPKHPGCFTLPMLFFPTPGNTSQCSEWPCFSPSLGLGLEGGPALPCPGGERWDSIQRQGALSPKNLFPSLWRRAWKCSPLNLPLHPLFLQFKTFPYHITCF